MKSNKANQASALAARRIVEPERVARPAHAAFMWGTVIVAWLVSLLPWRLWPGSPDLLLVVIAFWCIHEPSRIGMFTAFVFGILMDVHDAGLLGEHALAYTLVAYGAIVLHRRLQRFDLLSQAIHMLPVFIVAELLTVVIHAWLAGAWPGWQWGLGAALTAAIFPVVGWVLHLPTRGADDGEAASS